VEELPLFFFFTLERKLAIFHGKKERKDKAVLASCTQAKGSEVNSAQSDERVSVRVRVPSWCCRWRVGRDVVGPATRSSGVDPSGPTVSATVPCLPCGTVGGEPERAVSRRAGSCGSVAAVGRKRRVGKLARANAGAGPTQRQLFLWRLGGPRSLTCGTRTRGSRAVSGTCCASLWPRVSSSALGYGGITRRRSKEVRFPLVSARARRPER
jgi:hypothetical protein